MRAPDRRAARPHHLRLARLRLANLLLVSAGLGWPAAAPAFEPLFDTWLGFDAGARPLDARLADLDRDGDLDLVAAGEQPYSASLSVLMNDGGGTYAAPVAYPGLTSAGGVATGDLDGDLDPDVVVASSGGTTVSRYRNRGDGTFDPPVAFAAGSGPFGLAIADFDGDGDRDVAVANFGPWPGGTGTTVSLLRNDGTGSFSPPVAFAAGSGPYRLAAADLNGDGRPDLAVANAARRPPFTTQQMNVLMNDGAGGFAAPVAYTAFPIPLDDGWVCIEAADVDRDLDQDLFFSSPRSSPTYDYGGFALFRNRGDGTFGPYEAWSFGLVNTVGAYSIASADLDGDGWMDAVANSTGGWIPVLNDGAGGFLPSVRFPAGQHPVVIVAGDVDRDGDADPVVVSDYSLEATVHRNPGDGRFALSPTHSSFRRYMDAADIDGDGDLDVAGSGPTFNTGMVSILRNRGDGTFDPAVDLPAARWARYVTLVELGGPSGPPGAAAGSAVAPPDLLWASGNPPYNAYTRQNQGDGTFGPEIVQAVGACATGEVGAWDLDGDGDRDICLTEEGGCPSIPESGKRIWILKNRGDGTFEAPYAIVVDWAPGAITAGDFNRDQRLDLATAHRRSHDYVNIHLGRGDGTFAPPLRFTVGEEPIDIVTADLNGDGILDLATCNAGVETVDAETMAVLIGRGDGTFFAAATYPGSFNPEYWGTTWIVAGDADRDGDRDLMVANFGSNDISLYLNRGDGTFEPHVRYGAGYSPEALCYGDFTGDGIGDMAVGVSGGVTIVRGRAATAGVAGEAPRDGLAPGLLGGRAAPNPAGGAVRVTYSLARPERVRLRIVDAGGREVRALDAGLRPAGSGAVTWDGRTASGTAAPGGAYFYEIRAGRVRAAGKILRLH